MTAPLPAPLSARSGRVKAARRLQRRVHRTEEGLFLAEGAKALTEALRAPAGVVEVFATERAGEEYAALRKAVDEAGVPWTLVADDAVAALSRAVTPQGIVSVCRPVDLDLTALLDLPLPPDVTPLVIVGADVRDPGNAGTMIRTADAAGATGVVLTGQSVDPYNDKTVRATVGSLWHLPLALERRPETVLRAVREHGCTVLAADAAGETDLFSVDDLLTGPVAWLFGNESWGLPEELAAQADHRVAIPIYGRAESLNLATAVAVCAYATARARH